MIDAVLKTLASYSNLLMVDAAVWRKQTTVDAGGGQTVTLVDQARTVKVQLVNPSPQERQTAAQEGVQVDLSAVMPTDVDLVRGDRLKVGGRTVELLADPQTATHSSVSRAPVREEPFDEPTG